MSSDAISVLRADPTLSPLIDEHGTLAVEPADDPFVRLVRSIISQQVSTAAATTIRERLFAAVEVTPTGLLAADESILREAGLSRQKAGYVRNVAEAFDAKEYSPTAFAAQTDEEVLAEITSITGVGTWTGKMFLVFSLGREDVFPVEDLGIRKAMWALYGEELTREEMVERAESWRPYRSYASRYLWRAIDSTS